jgi:hypothetical protein
VHTIEAEPAMKNASWPMERVLFALAGSMTLLSVLLAVVVSQWFLVLTAAVGLNQWAFVLTGNCPAGLALDRLGFRRGADWRCPSTDLSPRRG